MMSSLELTNIFFSDLKNFNKSNFRTLEKADLSEHNAVIHKAFSSVITRYWIFSEKHPEISEEDKHILYFKLKIDMVARFFADYPDESNTDLLRAFQIELQQYVRDQKHLEIIESGDDDADAVAL
jgi:hypothetical protein